MSDLDQLARNAENAFADSNAWLAYANACTYAKEWARAERAYAHLHALAPDHGGIARNLLRTMGEQGKTVEAITLAARWLARFPDDIAMWKRVVTLAQEGQHFDSELSAHKNLTRLEPNAPEHRYRLACTHLSLDQSDEARSLLVAARARWPNDLRFLWLSVSSPNSLPASRGEMDQDRAQSEAALEAVEIWHGDTTQAFEALGRSQFYFAYHGENEAPRARRVAQQIERITHLERPEETLSHRPRATHKLRVVFVSAFWHKHTIARYFGGWVEHLDRTQFEVALAHDGRTRDEVTLKLEACVDAVLRPSESLTFANAIRDWLPDIVIFADVGMVGKHYPMFAYRLAPLQLAAWGHPVTTGFSCIDGFITAAAMESPAWRTHYTEQHVIQLPGLGVFYTPPEIPAAQNRAFFGFIDSNLLLCCPQSLFKIHLDDEAIFCRILAEIPDAHIVFFALAEANATQRFRERFSRACGRVGVSAARFTILPQMSHAQFLQVLTVSDGIIDTRHFSGGNTSLDALACGVPVISWPGEFMRGRQTAGMLRLIGAEGFIASSADEYVQLVSRLRENAPSSERDARKQSAERLWRDLAPVRALEQALVALAQAQR
jgi:protein O-GlcNAc transferase